MKQAWVLMTALPPTKGHLHLVQFASRLSPEPARVILSTQPDEPFAFKRWAAMHDACQGGVAIVHRHDKKIEQNPEAPGFWEMWRYILEDYGFCKGDYIVASEPYGKRLAQEVGGIFMPYDPYREVYGCKATDVRADLQNNFDRILPEFQRYIRPTVTFFGAESTGKTTLSKYVAHPDGMNGWWLPEWARPYLETVGTEITTESMTAIWHGQRALQRSAYFLEDKPWVIQDTDLFSTVGYWDFWDMNTPEALKKDAIALKSDLYVITQSNIPFEKDPIRYGGDKRESDDQYWVDLCERYGLNYVVLESDNLSDRLAEVKCVLADYWQNNVANVLKYERQFNG